MGEPEIASSVLYPSSARCWAVGEPEFASFVLYLAHLGTSPFGQVMGRGRTGYEPCLAAMQVIAGAARARLAISQVLSV